MTTQTLENLQIATVRFESGMTFEPPAPGPVVSAATRAQVGAPQRAHNSRAFHLKAEARTRTNFQESFKYEGVTPRSHTVREVPGIESNELNDLNLSEWLGVRDDFRNWLVGARSIPYCSTLIRSSGSSPEK
jgi:hypothetical protein